MDTSKLMPCYFGSALKQIINWAVAARKKYPGKRILTTKLDVKVAFRRCHLNADTAMQTNGPVSVLETHPPTTIKFNAVLIFNCFDDVIVHKHLNRV
jgi:hypothetical protein